MRLPQGILTIVDLATEVGIDPKVARGRLRRHFDGRLQDFGLTSWTYGPEDRQRMLAIISAKNPIASSSRPRRPTKTPTNVPSQEEVVSAGHSNASDFVEKAPLVRLANLRKQKTMLPLDRGLYAMFFDVAPGITPLDDTLTRDGLHLLYIGTAGGDLSKQGTLRKRIGNHLSCRVGSSTFAKSLAALMPELLDDGPIAHAVGNSRNDNLRSWIDRHVSICWTPHLNPLALEAMLLARHVPPLNLDKSSHGFKAQLKLLRSAI